MNRDVKKYQDHSHLTTIKVLLFLFPHEGSISIKGMGPQSHLNFVDLPTMYIAC